MSAGGTGRTGGAVARTDGRVDAVDRRLLLMGVPGVALLILGGLALPHEAGSAPGAWGVVAAAVPVVLVLTVPAASVARSVVPRLLLRLSAVLGLVVCGWWAFAREPGSTALAPWVWWVGPAVAAFATLLWSARAGVVLTLLWAAVVPVSLLLADGSVARPVLALAAVHSSDVVFVGLFLVLRRQMLDRVALARATAEQDVRRFEERAWAAEQARVTALVHDEVLSALVAVALVPDDELRAVRDQAGRAVHRVDAELDRLGTAADVRTDLVPAADLVAALRAAGAELEASLVTGSSAAGSVALPRTAADTLVGACAEALRNTTRHAPGAPRALHVETLADAVLIRVRDEGPGFDLAAVPASRLGVRVSILGRLDAVPGCFGDVDSAPGRGTTITLGWRRP